jgi:hypothetical protein
MNPDYTFRNKLTGREVKIETVDQTADYHYLHVRYIDTGYRRWFAVHEFKRLFELLVP